MTSVLMGICHIITIVFSFFYEDKMNLHSEVFHVSSEIILMTVILFMYILHIGNKQDVDESEKYFRFIFITDFAMLFFDINTWLLNGSIWYGIINNIIKKIIYIGLYIHGYLFFKYIFSFINDKNEHIKIIEKLLKNSLIVGFALRVVLTITNQYFIVDNLGNYNNNLFSIASYLVIPIVCILACGVVLGNNGRIRKVLPLLIYPISILLAAIVGIVSIEYSNTLIGISLALIVIYCASFIDMSENSKNLNESFHAYLTDEVADDIMNNKAMQTPGGSLAHATILFCSINNFSNIMENMDPDEAVKMLNHFYGSINSIIESNHGSIFEYPKYGVFCGFGEFSGCEDHAETALRVAYEIKRKMRDINQWNIANHYQVISIAMGINTGDAVVGNIGGSNHLDYTAIGNTVNIASRCCTYSNNNEIVITENVSNECTSKKITTKFIDKIIPKGVATPISIYRFDGGLNAKSK